MTQSQVTKEQKTELLSELNPVIEYAVKMLQAGVLVKNAIKHFTNKGYSLALSTNLIEIAEFNYNELKK